MSDEGRALESDGRHRADRRLETRRGVLASVGTSAGARMLVIPISAVLGIVVTRLLVTGYGQATYAQYILLVGLAALLPFADLGLGAAIMNAVAGARDPRSDAHLRGVLVSSLRMLAICGPAFIVAAVIIYLGGWWQLLLGGGLTLGSGALAATLCISVFGLTVLISFGQRVLIALGRNWLVIVLGGVQTPIVLLSLWSMRSAGVTDGGYLPVVSYAATMLGALLCLVIATRRIRPMLGDALRAAADPHAKGERVFGTAWPMLLQMVALPIAMSSDRVVLSHLGTLPELTEYALASQMFTPIYGVISGAGQALWPVFARARSQGKAAPLTPGALSLGFAGLAALAAGLLCACAGFLADLASGGQIRLGWPLLVTFSVFNIVQAAKSPYGMYLTDARGLRFQALWIVFGLLPLNLGLTIALTPSLGAVGPLIGSIASVVLCQVIPNLVAVRRRIRTGAADPRTV